MSTKALATQIKLTSFSWSALLFYRYILQPDLLEHSCYILQRLLLLFFMEFLLLAITFFFYLAVFQQLLFVEFYPIQLPGLLGCAFGSNNDALPNHLFFFHHSQCFHSRFQCSEPTNYKISCNWSMANQLPHLPLSYI